MSTPMQTMFPPKPKKVITPLTPQHEADAIRRANAPKPAPVSEEALLEELEELADEVLTKRTRTRK